MIYINTDNLKRRLIYLIICASVVGFLGYGAYKVKANKRLKCSDFKTQIEAQDAYNKGATYLDGWDHDKQACESLPLWKKSDTKN